MDLQQYEALERALLSEIDLAEDCLRLYRLTAPTHPYVREHGRFKATDLDGPLVV